jgi:hypothetical protein
MSIKLGSKKTHELRKNREELGILNFDETTEAKLAEHRASRKLIKTGRPARSLVAPKPKTNGRPKGRRNWSEAKRIEFITTYLAMGNFAQTCAVTRIPLHTAHNWRKQPWWKEFVAQVQAEGDVEVDTKISKIVSRTLAQLEDRVEHGDHILDSRTGEVRRIPVKLRDLTGTTTQLLQRREVIRKAPAAAEQAEATQDRLNKLAEQFTRMVQGVTNKINEKVIEGEIIDITPEKST